MNFLPPMNDHEEHFASDDGSVPGMPPMSMEDCPSTPPQTPPSRQSKRFSSPPPIQRHDRPVTRCVFTQEAQEGLSLPDLGGTHMSSRSTIPHSPTSVVLHLRHHTQLGDVASPPSLPMRHLRRGMYTPRSSNASLQPRAVPWGDVWDNLSHNKSQRHFDSDMA